MNLPTKNQNSTNLFRVKEFEINWNWGKIRFPITGGGGGGNQLNPYQIGHNLHIHQLPTVYKEFQK